MGDKLAEALALQPADYLAAPEGLATRSGSSALRRVLEYRAITDLQRGWRVTLPNLEQTGLIVVDYPLVKELASREDFWQELTSVSAPRIPSSGLRFPQSCSTSSAASSRSNLKRCRSTHSSDFSGRAATI